MARGRVQPGGRRGRGALRELRRANLRQRRRVRHLRLAHPHQHPHARRHERPRPGQGLDRRGACPTCARRHGVPGRRRGRPRRRRGHRRGHGAAEPGHRRRGHDRLGVPDRVDHQAVDGIAGDAAGGRGPARPRRAHPPPPARVPHRGRVRGGLHHGPPAAEPHGRLRGRHLHRHGQGRRLPREVRAHARATRRSCSRPASASRTTTPATACSGASSRCCAGSRSTTASASGCSRRSASPTPRTGPTRRSCSAPRSGHIRPDPGRRPGAGTGVGAGTLERPGRLDARHAPPRPAGLRADAHERGAGRGRHGRAVARRGRADVHRRPSSCPSSGSWATRGAWARSCTRTPLACSPATTATPSARRASCGSCPTRAWRWPSDQRRRHVRAVPGHRQPRPAGARRRDAAAAAQRRRLHPSASTPAATWAPTPRRSWT